MIALKYNYTKSNYFVVALLFVIALCLGSCSTARPQQELQLAVSARVQEE